MKNIPLKIIGKKASTRTIVSDEDFEVLNKYRWYLSSVGYACRNFKENGKTFTMPMHRQIMKAVRGQVVDHLDFNRTNNQRENLRICTQAQNVQRQNKRLKRSKWRFLGISFNGNSKRSKRWTASVGGKHIGRFSTDLEAAKAYDRLAIEIYGRHATVNFPHLVCR